MDTRRRQATVYHVAHLFRSLTVRWPEMLTPHSTKIQELKLTGMVNKWLICQS